MTQSTYSERYFPSFAANSFYDALVKVPNYDSIPVTKAAQLVQRSAYPDAYAQHESDARVLASALSGYSKAAFSCVVTITTPGAACAWEASMLSIVPLAIVLYTSMA